MTSQSQKRSASVPPHACCMAKTVFLVYCYVTLVWYTILFFYCLFYTSENLLFKSVTLVWLSEFTLKSTTTLYFFLLTGKILHLHFSTEAYQTAFCSQFKLLVIMLQVKSYGKKKWLGLWRHETYKHQHGARVRLKKRANYGKFTVQRWCFDQSAPSSESPSHCADRPLWSETSLAPVLTAGYPADMKKGWEGIWAKRRSSFKCSEITETCYKRGYSVSPALARWSSSSKPGSRRSQWCSCTSLLSDGSHI